MRRGSRGPKPWTALGFRDEGQETAAAISKFENWNRFYDPSIGRYLSPDPILLSPKAVVGFASQGMSTPAYAYANNNPIAFADPFGLWTVVIIFPGTGAHVAVYVDRGVGGEPTLFDPGGSYSPFGPDTAWTYVGKDEGASWKQYQSYWSELGETPKVFMFETTEEEEAAITKNFDALTGGSDPGPGACATTCSNALDGVGPFQGLGTYILPGSMAGEMRDLWEAHYEAVIRRKIQEQQKQKPEQAPNARQAQ